MLHLYNTLSRKIEAFRPLHHSYVTLYTCGMTVYDYAHIGHGFKYVHDDVLRRTLEYLDFKVKHVQNVTDVGHLTSDADTGEDKLEKGAKKHGKSVWDVARFFTDHFYASMDALNVLRPHVICKATEHIKEQIDLVKTLIEKGYAYETSEAVYFDISKFPGYQTLFGQKLEEKKAGSRKDVYIDTHKKNPADFVLWFKRTGKFKDHAMFWGSPWGDGFPGWHIECSAMSMKYLGSTIDIHTGGIDHIPVHHPNEIAQSEAATGRQFVKCWIHHAFLTIDGRKMSKSLGNLYTIKDITDRGYDPMSLRYLYLTAHHRSPLSFTWKALTQAQESLSELRLKISRTKNGNNKGSSDISLYKNEFIKAIENDINTPQALAVIWEVVKSRLSKNYKLRLILDFDKVLGLGLDKANAYDTRVKDIPQDIQELVIQRQNYRKAGKYKEADIIRKKIAALGYLVEDTQKGPQIHTSHSSIS